MTEMPIYSATFTGCIISARDGVERHFINGAYGRDGDLPAVINPDGTRLWYVENPKRGQMRQRDAVLRREGDKPAIEHANGDRHYYRFGKLHRDGGMPAMEMVDGMRVWFEEGKEIRRERHPPE